MTIDEESKHEKIQNAADSFADTISKLTGASSTIIIYGYHFSKMWRYGMAGEADDFQRLGILKELEIKLTQKDL